MEEVKKSPKKVPKKSQKSLKKKVLFGKVSTFTFRSVRCMEPVLVSLSGQKSGPEEV